MTKKFSKRTVQKKKKILLAMGNGGGTATMSLEGREPKKTC